MFGEKEKVTVANVPLEKNDRVAAYHNGALRKGRVAEADTMGIGMVGVTFAKGDDVKMYNRCDVFPLYRYVNTPFGQAAAPICTLPADNE